MHTLVEVSIPFYGTEPDLRPAWLSQPETDNAWPGIQCKVYHLTWQDAHLPHFVPIKTDPALDQHMPVFNQ